MKNFSVFEETRLPPRQAFHNDLTGEDIFPEKYEFAQRVWDTTGCQTLGDYHDLYLYQEIFLLADILEQFCQVCLTNYQLDPAHYYTVPGLAWDTSLKKTKIWLSNLHDIEMHQFLERGMRGGISMITHRYAQANNPLIEHVDLEKPTSYIYYLDANNLYGYAQPLPVDNFEWVSEREIASLHVMTVTDEADTGHILEVDLKYHPNYLTSTQITHSPPTQKMKITHAL